MTLEHENPNFPPNIPDAPEFKACDLTDAIENLKSDNFNLDWSEVDHYSELEFENREHSRRIKKTAIDLLKAVDSENVVLLNLIKSFRV